MCDASMFLIEASHIYFFQAVMLHERPPKKVSGLSAPTLADGSEWQSCLARLAGGPAHG